MPESSGIILTTVESSLFNSPPKAHPSNIYVVSYSDGRLRAFTGVPSAYDRRRSRFCYIVDTAEHRVTGTSYVPTCVDRYSFSVELQATWKVTNAEAVVRANLSNGNEVVLAWLRDELWLVGRHFQPQDAVGAETAARSVLAPLKQLDEGITVLRAAARFRMDDRLTRAELEIDADSHQNTREMNAAQNLRNLFDAGDEWPIMVHLLRNPTDTANVLKMMADARDRNQTMHLALLDRMLENNLITDADAQPLRDTVLGRSAGPFIPGRPLGGRIPQQLLPPATATPSAFATGQSAADSAGSSTAKAIAAKDVQEPAQPVEPDVTAEPLSDPPPAGGVKNWKPLRRNSGQGAE